MRITEIFKSIQGESSWAGLPCAFVRTTGCNLRCVWCDTQYAFEGGTELPVNAVLERVAALQCKLVEITGGEPLLHADVPELCQKLLRAGYTVLVETSGERPIEVLPAGVIRIMDLKCPDSGMDNKNRYENVAQLTARDEVKFVLASRRDYEWAREKIAEYRLADRVGNVLLSVVHGKLQSADVVAWLLEDNLQIRFQLQMHKFIWDPSVRGV